MERSTIGTFELDFMNLQVITYFKPRFAWDLAINPTKNVDIGTKEKPKVVDCHIRKSMRQYDHFGWLEKLAEQVEKDPDRIVRIVQNTSRERALAVNRVM